MHSQHGHSLTGHLKERILYKVLGAGKGYRCNQTGVVAMAGSQGDICRVSLKGQRGSAVFRNIWFYQLTDPGTAGYLSGLLTEFQSVVLTPYAASLTTGFTFTELIVTNIFSGDEVIDVTPTPAAGTRGIAGDELASFLAALIVLERQNGRVRNGRKFAPLSLESDIVGNVLVAGTITLLTNAANAMAAVLFPGGTDHFSPAIVGRIPYTTSSGKVAYRLPASQAEMGNNFSLSSSARVINRVTTMNSRKFWRGE